jgi:hypothetical protein
MQFFFYYSTKLVVVNFHMIIFLPKPASNKKDRLLMDPTYSALAHMQGVLCVSLKINSLALDVIKIKTKTHYNYIN